MPALGFSGADTSKKPIEAEFSRRCLGVLELEAEKNAEARYEAYRDWAEALVHDYARRRSFTETELTVTSPKMGYVSFPVRLLSAGYRAMELAWDQWAGEHRGDKYRIFAERMILREMRDVEFRVPEVVALSTDHGLEFQLGSFMEELGGIIYKVCRGVRITLLDSFRMDISIPELLIESAIILHPMWTKAIENHKAKVVLGKAKPLWVDFDHLKMSLRAKLMATYRFSRGGIDLPSSWVPYDTKRKRVRVVVSLDDGIVDENGDSVVPRRVDPNVLEPIDELDRNSGERVFVFRILSRLSVDERDVVFYRQDRLTREEIGELLGLTKVRVNQLSSGAISKIEKAKEELDAGHRRIEDFPDQSEHFEYLQRVVGPITPLPHWSRLQERLNEFFTENDRFPTPKELRKEIGSSFVIPERGRKNGFSLEDSLILIRDARLFMETVSALDREQVRLKKIGEESELAGPLSRYSVLDDEQVDFLINSRNAAVRSEALLLFRLLGWSLTKVASHLGRRSSEIREIIQRSEEILPKFRPIVFHSAEERKMIEVQFN